jgi:hypothetical protein
LFTTGYKRLAEHENTRLLFLGEGRLLALDEGRLFVWEALEGKRIAEGKIITKGKLLKGNC